MSWGGSEGSVYQNKEASGIDGITVEEVSKYLKENKDTIFAHNILNYCGMLRKCGNCGILLHGKEKNKWRKKKY